MPPELSPEPIEFEIRARITGKRIDAYLVSRFQDYSRSVIQKVIDAGAVEVNGQKIKASYRVREGDRVRIWLPILNDDPPPPEDIPIRVVYEDASFVVVDKHAGIIMHPAKGNWSGTLVNALQFHFENLSAVGGAERPGIIHRLDRDTTGLVMIAKEDQAHRLLALQFEERTIRKEYRAIVYGAPERDSDYIERPIGVHPTVREKMAIRSLVEGGKEAVTFYEVVERFDGFAHVRCLPRTGRTHQIRVHLAHIGHPVVADAAYANRARLTLGDLAGADHAGADEILIERQALHAHRLHVTHPRSGEPLEFEAPLPPDMSRVLEALRLYRPIQTRAREEPKHKSGRGNT